MKAKILGCSGGIGGPTLRTTAIQIDHDILLDCGTGVGDLPVAELAGIDHVFLTHSHLDHFACLPLLIDTVNDLRDRPLTVHGTEATLRALREHVFNWVVWPDFSQIPSPQQPSMVYRPLEPNRPLLLDGRRITALPANHTVPAVGYHLDSGTGSLVFSGDTGPCPELWTKINAIANLKILIIETAFPNRELALANASKHLCPDLLAAELARLKRPAEIFITHLKPGQAELTMSEISTHTSNVRPQMLQHRQTFEF